MESIKKPQPSETLNRESALSRTVTKPSQVSGKNNDSPQIRRGGFASLGDLLLAELSAAQQRVLQPALPFDCCQPDRSSSERPSARVGGGREAVGVFASVVGSG